jgi:rare lipoprotein A
MPGRHRAGELRRFVLLATRLCAVVGLAACTAPRANEVAQAPLTASVDPAMEEAQRLDALPPVPPVHGKHPAIDASGRNEIGRASFYGTRFDGRRMANGDRFDPRESVAASKTLPLGTTAKVIDLDTGHSAIVTVEDRGPHVDGRVLDVSPEVAAKLAMRQKGVAPVVVKPIAVPQPQGSIKLGAGAASATTEQVQAAVQTTKRLAVGSGD